MAAPMPPVRRSPAARPRRRFAPRSAALLLALFAAACEGGTGPSAPAELRKLAGDGVPGTAGAPLSLQAAVRVVDERGRGVGGVEVRWETADEGASLSDAVAVSDGDGEARVTWRLGRRAGPQTLTARVEGVPPATFTATAAAGAAALLVSERGHGQTVPVATEVPERPVVRVTDAFGNPVAGAHVTFFSGVSGSELAGAEQTTDAEGRAQLGRWTISTRAGLNVVTARVQGLVDQAYFHVHGSPGPAAGLRVDFGDGQSAPPGERTAIRPRVLVLDAYENAVPGVAVGFQATGGGGSVTGPQGVADALGRASPGQWILGPAAGPNTLTASVGALAPVVFHATGVVPAGDFDVEVRLLTPPGEAAGAAYAQAAARWERVIRADLPDARVQMAANTCFDGQPALDEVVDDLLMLAVVDEIDGPGGVLAQAGPCAVRADTRLPAVALVRLDRADVDQAALDGWLDDVVLHELGHGLGIGTLWLRMGLVRAEQFADPRFTGIAAAAAYAHLRGGAPGEVPLDDTQLPGTFIVHWRESVFGSELMTGFVDPGGNPLSLLTAASLRDLGYIVDTSAADPFSLAPALVGPGGRRIELREAPFHPPLVVVDPARR